MTESAKKSGRYLPTRRRPREIGDFSSWPFARGLPVRRLCPLFDTIERQPVFLDVAEAAAAMKLAVNALIYGLNGLRRSADPGRAAGRRTLRRV